MENLGLAEYTVFYKGKRVLVTGATGFKGSWICSVLLQFGADVYGIGLEPNTQPAMFEQLKLENKIKLKIADIRDFEMLKTVFDEFSPDIVIHLAAQPLVIDSYSKPRYTYGVNVMGTVNVCECIRLCSSVRSFVNVTTDKVYENLEQEGYSYKETDRLNGYDPYSNSKSCSELVTQSYDQSFLNNNGVSVSTCRAGNVIGGGDYSLNRIIPDCFKYSKTHESIILRNPNSVRPYQHVLEADMFYIMLAMRQYEDNKYAGHYNIGPDDVDCITTGDICSMFCKEWGNNANWTAIDYNGPHEANFLKLDNSKAKTVLGWAPKWNVEEAIHYAVDWYKAMDSDKEDITRKQIEAYLEDR